MESIGERIASIRRLRGLTQEQLADAANINLRTLQRIENNETEPRGNTLRSLCAILNIDIKEVIDYGKIEDRTYLVCVQLSALSFLVLPLGNILFPMMLWVNKRDKIIDLQEQGAGLLNIQLLWSALFYGVIVFAMVVSTKFVPLQFVVLLALVNIAFIVWVSVRIQKKKLKKNYPKLIKIV